MSERPPFNIGPASNAADIAAVAALFRAYAASLPVDLSYQNFEAELAALPGKYAPPKGALFIARDNAGIPIGCVALRAMDDAGCCEMKRLYVAPRGRGLGFGNALVEAICAAAQHLGYREIRLDSLPSMSGAIALYRKLEFEDIAPYYDTPIAGTVFLSKRL